MDVNPPVLPVMYLIVPHDRIAVGPYLNPRQRIPVNIIVLDQSSSFPEDVNAALVSVVDLIPTDRWVAVRSDPDASEVVRVDLVVDELAETVLVDIYATRLAMVDLTVDDCRICASFHFEPGYAVVVDIVRFKVALDMKIVW